MAVAELLCDADDPERVTEIEGRTRSYFVEDGRQSDLIAPWRIPDTDLYIETNFSANECVRNVE